MAARHVYVLVFNKVRGGFNDSLKKKKGVISYKLLNTPHKPKALSLSPSLLLLSLSLLGAKRQAGNRQTDRQEKGTDRDRREKKEVG